jgi:hypothetical protein
MHPSTFVDCLSTDQSVSPEAGSTGISGKDLLRKLPLELQQPPEGEPPPDLQVI